MNLIAGIVSLLTIADRLVQFLGSSLDFCLPYVYYLSYLWPTITPFIFWFSAITSQSWLAVLSVISTVFPIVFAFGIGSKLNFEGSLEQQLIAMIQSDIYVWLVTYIVLLISAMSAASRRGRTLNIIIVFGSALPILCLLIAIYRITLGRFDRLWKRTFASSFSSFILLLGILIGIYAVDFDPTYLMFTLGNFNSLTLHLTLVPGLLENFLQAKLIAQRIVVLNDGLTRERQGRLELREALTIRENELHLARTRVQIVEASLATERLSRQEDLDAWNIQRRAFQTRIRRVENVCNFFD